MSLRSSDPSSTVKEILDLRDRMLGSSERLVKIVWLSTDAHDRAVSVVLSSETKLQ